MSKAENLLEALIDYGTVNEGGSYESEYYGTDNYLQTLILLLGMNSGSYTRESEFSVDGQGNYHQHNHYN